VKLPVQIVGTGPQLQELQQLASSLGADVRFSGFLSGDVLHDAVRGARAVVLPSEWYENAPLSVLEAYALGKAVIGARIGGIPELIREHQTGMGFTSGDQQALTTALLQVAGMPDTEVEAMGRCGRQWMEAEFTAELYRQRVLGLYRELGVGGAVAAAENRF
jgi:glycosyltransferase involved in cell wall biosynthesis